MAKPKANNTNVARRRITPAKKPFIKRLGSAIVETAKEKDTQLVVGGAMAFCVVVVGAAVLADRYMARR